MNHFKHPIFKHHYSIFCLIVTLLTVTTLRVWASTPYSTSELDELEKQFIQQINHSDSIERNPLASQYINHLGDQLARPTGIKSYFFIVKSGDINAFAGPGGYIGINTQLILASSTESELAAVMAHELAHVRLHHLYYMSEHEKQMKIPMLASLLVSAALGVLNPTLGSSAMMASLTGFAQNTINFTRAREKEADRIGIDILSRSGFDPRAMASFFKKMQQTTRYYDTGHLPAILLTHPLDEDRIAEAENRSTPLTTKFFASNLNYLLFKELIRTSVVYDNKKLLDYYHYQCKKQYQDIACQYGYALALLKLHRYKDARHQLHTLLNLDNTNLFLQLAMTDAEIGTKDLPHAKKRLDNLQVNYPDNYAVLMAKADGLLATGNTNSAINLLLKGSRIFKDDLVLCEKLAHAQAQAHHKRYAYFTNAKCQLLQGRHREAIRQLKLVKKLAKNDTYLLARAKAMITEITLK
jgi:predicted Zn-dependent protease